MHGSKIIWAHAVVLTMKCYRPVYSAVRRGVAAVALAFCYAVVAAPAPTPTAPLAGPGSLAGIWMKSGYKNLTLASLQTPERNKVQRTSAGEWPPLRPQAHDEVERRIKLSEQGNPVITTLTQCLPGIPVMLLGGGGYPIQILETPGQVTMLFEELNHFRLIHLNREHPEDPDPTYMGHSVGHWEGDTFVVDTVALMATTPLDWLGSPHSEDLHLIERYRRTGKDTLELIITIDDPKTFTKPWDAKQIFKVAPADVGLTEYICENNRDAHGESED